MSILTAKDQIHIAAMGWDGVSAHPHRFGGTEYRVDRREIGHIHSNLLVDIPFPKRIRDKVVAAGQASQHHFLPDSGWVTVHIKQNEDIEQAIALLKMSFELALAHNQQRQQSTDS